MSGGSRAPPLIVASSGGRVAAAQTVDIGGVPRPTADTDVCVQDPGKDVDVYFATDLRTMIQVWMGNISWRVANNHGRLKIVAHQALIRDVKPWLLSSVFAGIPTAREIAQ